MFFSLFLLSTVHRLSPSEVNRWVRWWEVTPMLVLVRTMTFHSPAIRTVVSVISCLF